MKFRNGFPGRFARPGKERILLTSVLLLLFLGTVPAKGGHNIFEPSYTEVMSFPDILPLIAAYHSEGITHDGNYYWSVSGGNSIGKRLGQHNGVTGALIATYSPGFSFRSVFTDGGGAIFARAFDSRIILEQKAPGVFQPSGITLTGGPLDSQSSVVVYTNVQKEYIAQKDGTVSRWDSSGLFIDTIQLQGYGSIPGELNYPADREIAAGGDYWLTYSDGILSAWDYGGHRVDQTTLIGAGTAFDSYMSLSYTNGMVFVNDGDDQVGTWRGYDVGAIPEPGSISLLVLGMMVWRRRWGR